MIKVKSCSSYSGSTYYSLAEVSLDDKRIAYSVSYLISGAWLQQLSDKATIEGCRGKRLTVKANCNSAVTVQKYIKRK